jgi:hypothetical protein
MHGFSIWHWLIFLGILIGFIGTPIWYIFKSIRSTWGRNPPGIEGPYGFKGWLVPLLIGQTFAPLYTLGEMANSSGEIKAAHVTYRGTPTFFLNLFLAGFLVLEIVVAVKMHRRRKDFPSLFQFQWVTAILLSAATVAIFSSVLGMPIDAKVNAELITSIAIDVVIGGLWVLYVRRSVRVRNTFTT